MGFSGRLRLPSNSKWETAKSKNLLFAGKISKKPLAKPVVF
jgi:hypothetical protein